MSSPASITRTCLPERLSLHIAKIKHRMALLLSLMLVKKFKIMSWFVILLSAFELFLVFF